MSDFDLHDQAIALMGFVTPYQLARRLIEMRAEHDALAAHVANSNADMLIAARNIREKANDDRHLHGVADMLERSAGEKPATSLARLKAEEKAE